MSDPRIVEWINGVQVVREMTTTEIAAMAVPAVLPPVPASISRRQAILAMLGAGMITAAEAQAWAVSNAPPSFVAAYIDMLPELSRAGAYVDFAAATEYQRTAPLVQLLGYAAGKSESEIDDLFRTAATL